jgi:hypothetical protein
MPAAIGQEAVMRTFLGTVLSAIAVGVLLIAYGLLGAGARAAGPSSYDDAPLSPLRVDSLGDIYRVDRARVAGEPIAYRTSDGMVRPVYASERIPLYTPERAPAPRRAAPAKAARKPARDWKQTALVIGGATGAGAGVGAIFGGKKGALIGAAIGGGASSIFEAARR